MDSPCGKDAVSVLYKIKVVIHRTFEGVSKKFMEVQIVYTKKLHGFHNYRASLWQSALEDFTR